MEEYDFYYWAVQGSIVEFAQTYEDARVLMQEAEAEEEEELGDDYDYLDSLCEYDYVKGGKVDSIKSYKAGEGGHEKAYSQINGGLYWHSSGDTYWGELPNWIKEKCIEYGRG